MNFLGAGPVGEECFKDETSFFRYKVPFPPDSLDLHIKLQKLTTQFTNDDVDHLLVGRFRVVGTPHVALCLDDVVQRILVGFVALQKDKDEPGLERRQLEDALAGKELDFFWFFLKEGG